MPYSKMNVNPDAGFVPSLGSINSNSWSLNGATSYSPSFSLGFLGKSGIGAALQAGGSIISGLINQAFAKRNLDRQVAAQKELTEFNLNKQIDLMLNEQRYKKMGLKNAGISTASMNGQFGGNAAVPTQSVGMPSSNAMPPINPVLGLQLAMEMKKNDAEVENLHTASQLNIANAENAYASAGKTDIEAYLLDTYGSRKYEADIAQLNAQEKKTLADRDFVVQKKLNEMSINEKEIQLLQQQYDINWKRLPKELALLSAQAFRETQQGKLAQKTQDEVQQKIYNLQRERDNIIRNGYLSDVQTDLIEAEIARIAAENANIGPAALYGKAKSYLMQKFPNLVKAGVVADTAISYVRNFAEIYSMLSGRGGSGGSVTTVSSGTGPKGNWSSTTTTTRK